MASLFLFAHLMKECFRPQKTLLTRSTIHKNIGILLQNRRFTNLLKLVHASCINDIQLIRLFHQSGIQGCFGERWGNCHSCSVKIFNSTWIIIRKGWINISRYNWWFANSAVTNQSYVKLLRCLCVKDRVRRLNRVRIHIIVNDWGF